jgi:hypothetical protein
VLGSCWAGVVCQCQRMRTNSGHVIAAGLVRIAISTSGSWPLARLYIVCVCVVCVVCVRGWTLDSGLGEVVGIWALWTLALRQFQDSPRRELLRNTQQPLRALPYTRNHPFVPWHLNELQLRLRWHIAHHFNRVAWPVKGIKPSQATALATCSC